ncbi:A disintegrin and metalloproteinase with thrombospondin motifs 17 [Notechis scutatus]|uniref:A disintegrin and metalloproteinase with thrombospondin motifs 17 n=1 Tax=Notechis scutatus TaxID=8663 RepID=A0A6J1UCZ8_9SAUR|nr:A disintegrin and metalloproteinase with thrombospondin motifs 17 [Notechis scutatus]
MFDGPFLFFTSSPLFALLLFVLGQASPETAVAELAVVIPEQVPLGRVHFLQPPKSGPNKAQKRRSVSLPEDAAQLLIRLPVGAGLPPTSDVYLMLHHDDRFLAPGFSVEEINENRSMRHHQAVDQLCFYTGHVLNRSHDSLASLSTCGGLVGHIQIGLEQVQIQPVNSSESSFHGKEHYVRRKRSSQGHSLKSTIPVEHCSVLPEKKKPPKGKLLHDWKGRRNAIHLTNEYTVETLVVADADMVQYHGIDAAQRFILTVMNMARLSIGHHGERSLESFCQWQNEEFGGAKYLGNNQVPGARDDTLPVDAAVFVTRTDFCVHKDEPCDTVGIAYLGGICSLKRKCVLAEDNGLNLAFTIAHELGHNMGMSHDDDHLSCAGRSHIMSGEWVKGRNPSDLSWSPCSRDDLEKFLKSKVSNCLLVTDPRSRYAVRLPYKLPGMHYSADEQCQILFGTNTTFCKNMEHLMCAGLWCLVEGDASCKTKLDPPLDGTECGADKWCRMGECVSKTPIPEHIDGDWSIWSQWSMCSRTCETGARFRQRKCDNPPPGPGGKNCQGASVEHTVCENLPCPRGVSTFRDQQCQSQDRSTNKKKSLWTAVIVDGMFQQMKTRLHFLYSDTLKIGCDGIIGSSAKEDHCGICNGNGKTCKVVKGDFNHTKGMVSNSQCKKVSTCVMARTKAVPKCFSCYIEAAVIPAGARRIRVMEDKPGHSFLALKDSSKKSINSDWKIELPGEFQIAGTTIRYVRRGLWEKMSAKGPTKIPLHLLLGLFVVFICFIFAADFFAASAAVASAMASFVVMLGERKTIVSCTQIVNKTMMLVNNSACQRATRPEPQVRRCNAHPCQSRWVTGQWSPCSSTCAKGLQHREVTCVYQLQNGSYVNTRDLYCLGPKPATIQSCEGRDCLSIWEASEWSKCSSDCGRGKQKRKVMCTNSQGKCDAATRPRDEEECEDHTGCYEWKTGEWSKCSSTCGKGLQSRVVQCMHKVTGRHGNECPTFSKLAAYRQCHQQACNEKINVNTITSPRLAALTYKCTGDQWAIYCRVIREKNLCQDMRWYQRCCQTCRDFYASKMQQKSS